MMRFVKIAAIAAAVLGVLVAGGMYGAGRYYASESGAGCASCHEMGEYASAVHSSPHRNMGCMQCHTASLATKLRHIKVHLIGPLPEKIRLRGADVLEMMGSCQRCHRQEFASWHAGPHGATYSRIFADPVHNGNRRLMDDCLRCHGMHFDGAVRDLVRPLDTKGPWRIVDPGLRDQPTMPCLTCHWVHREGDIERKPATRSSVAGSALHDSLAFFDRRERTHFTAALLTIPQLYDGARRVRVSPDQRQALCYQCHAPREPEAGTTAAAFHQGPQVGSGDDRTPKGVHEGLSCISCHTGHNENARASCATCHPELSNCGLDVEKMDTTYASASSSHNIHWVKCADCHQNGVPRKKVSTTVAHGD